MRLRNQKSVLFCFEGLDRKKDKCLSKNKSVHFVLKEIDRQIRVNEKIKKKYEEEFKKLSRRHKEIHLLKSLLGIGE